MSSRFYHGSKEPVALGTVFESTPHRLYNGDLFRGKAFEEYVEEKRPRNMPNSRRTSIFMVDSPYSVESAAGAENLENVYELRPITPVTRHHSNFLSDAYGYLIDAGAIEPEHSRRRGRGPRNLDRQSKLLAKADKLIASYWNQEVPKNLSARKGDDPFEYLTNRAEVIRRVGKLKQRYAFS